MVTVDADALSNVLGAVDLRVGIGRRTSVAAGTLLPIPADSITLVYIAEGAVQGHPPLGDGCRLDVDPDSQRLRVDTKARHDLLVAGDAFLTLGRSPFMLEARDDTSLMIADIELADAASPLPALLPPFLTVTGFDAVEPAAAALALNMGVLGDTVMPARQGDPIICRMMATTVLLSVIRTWAANGCAPTGWPSLSNDPFLDRVVDAIREEPGRDTGRWSASPASAPCRARPSPNGSAAPSAAPPPTTSPRCASTRPSGCSRLGEASRTSPASWATPPTRGSAGPSAAAPGRPPRRGVWRTARRSRPEDLGPRISAFQALLLTRLDAPNSTAPASSAIDPIT